MFSSASIYIVDAVNFLFRSYYAIGPMTNPKGESTNALYGFIRSIYKLIKEFSPDYFVAVFDGPDNKKSRTAIYKDYKSHREGMPPDLVCQLEKSIQFCTLAGIPHLSVPGVEADDTIGSIALWAKEKGANVFICSSDKDLCQLVSDKIRILNPHKDNLLIDEKKVKELFGVTPEQIVDLLAMMGDSSDNIPGLEGFGAKTAASLLSQFGSLDTLLAHPEKVSGKKQETLIQGKEIALLSRQLAALQTDVDFPKDKLFFRLKEPDLDKVRAFYQEMHFLSLLKELASSTSDAGLHKTETGETVSYTTVDEEEALNTLVHSLKKETCLCIDTETTDVRPMYAELIGIGLAAHPKKAWYVPMNGTLGKKRALELLEPLLEHPHIGWIGHNIKYDLHVLQNVGIYLNGVAFDTMIASYLLNPQNQRHNLDTLSLERFGKVKTPITDLIGKGRNPLSMAEVAVDKVSAYCCEDVDYTLRLKQLFEKELASKHLSDIFLRIELPLIPVLTRMERQGIYVDAEKLQEMAGELSFHLKALEKEIYTFAKEPFNINSPKQLSHILFEKLHLPAPKKTTTGYSTAADVLESLQEESPIIKKILEYRLFEKLRSTYVEALPEMIFPKTGRIHCTFNQSVAATGRLSCQDPNLQNIPIRSPEGKKIRAAFKPQYPHHSFLSADYSQIELRLLAHFSQDPKLLKAFQEGEDIHTYTASVVFNVPLQEVSESMRARAKAVNFGILYGQQAFGLSQELAIPFKEAAAFIETYFLRYPKVKDFLESCKEQARKTGYAITLTGRKRPIPDILSKNPMIRAAAERLAVNTPLQGSQADLIKLAMIQIDHLLLKNPELGLLLLQIHDELLFEVEDTYAEELGRQVKKLMETVFPLGVPLTVDISIGKNWSQC